MSMKVNNNYTSYYNNIFSNDKKESKQTIDDKLNKSDNIKDNEQEYYKRLCKKFSGITINTSKSIVSSSKNKIVLNLSNKCLKKMASNPSFAEKIEKNISDIPVVHKQMYNRAKSDGIEIHGFAVKINEDGSIQCSCSGSTRTNNTKQSSIMRNTEKAQKNKLKSKQVKDVKLNKSESNKDKVQEYYKQLCKKFPQINFNTNGGILSSNSSKVTVNLSYDCLKKMADDPKFAKEIEWNLSGEVAANSMIYGLAKRDGVILGGRTVMYDTNGNRQSSCGGMRTANTESQSNNTNKLKKKYKLEEEIFLKARKKREEKEKLDKKQAYKKEEEKKAAEKQAERKVFNKVITDTNEIAFGNIKTGIKIVSDTISVKTISFDVKA